MEKIGEPLHPDFQKILRQFQKRYGDKQGLSYFWGWVNNLGLNPDKPYGWRESAESAMDEKTGHCTASRTRLANLILAYQG